MAAGSDAVGGGFQLIKDVRAQRRLLTWLPRERLMVEREGDSGGREEM